MTVRLVGATGAGSGLVVPVACVLGADSPDVLNAVATQKYVVDAANGESVNVKTLAVVLPDLVQPVDVTVLQPPLVVVRYTLYPVGAPPDVGAVQLKLAQ